MKGINQMDRGELAAWICGMDEDARQLLYEEARALRERHYGKQVYTRGLIEISNYCKNNCYYCGIRRDNSKVERYRLDKEQILECCEIGAALGYHTFVLQGGEDPYFTDERLVDSIRAIKEAHPDCALTLSLGERSRESYQRLYDAGADRYLLRHETANEAHYRRLHPDELVFENRRRCLFDLQEIGFQVGAGFMVGSPGQTCETLADNLLFLKELQPAMVGIGPFIPQKDTPFGGEAAGSIQQTLDMVAMARILLPKALIPATTAVGTLDPQGREKALKAGANVVMPNLSPLSVRNKYLLYDNKICTDEDASECRGCLERRIKSAGFEMDFGRGDYIDWERLPTCR
ncbi:MAG: [FeFe] hydrogenase H-cluster radical SAM maturase HydE [Christensenellales bacterium]